MLSCCADNTCLPNQVERLSDKMVVQINAGSRHSLVLTSTNEVMAFGNSEEGQCGLGHQKCEPSPKQVKDLPTLPVLFVAAGKHCLSIRIHILHIRCLPCWRLTCQWCPRLSTCLA